MSKRNSDPTLEFLEKLAKAEPSEEPDRARVSWGTFERSRCPECGAELFRGLCPGCSFDGHPEREVKKHVFPDTV